MTDPVQEQLIAARKTQILDAAASVFAEKGFHPTTIKDIAREADIADGTIYNYFKNKSALLIGIFERMRETTLQTEITPELAEMDLRGFLRASFQHPLMALKSNNFELFRVVISEMLVNAEVRALYYEQVLKPTLAQAEAPAHLWAQQYGLSPVNGELFVRAMSAVVLGMILQNIMGDETLQKHWDELPDFLANLFIDGLGNQAP